MPLSCGNCGREIRGERFDCLYCGWSKADGLSGPTAAQPVAGSREPQKFRSGATMGRFFMWAVTASIAGILLIRLAPATMPPAGLSPSLIAAMALFVLGPLAFVAQLLRAALVTVTVDPERGLILSGGRSIPWINIEGIRYAGARVRLDQAIIGLLLSTVSALSERVASFGLMSVLRLLLLAAVGLMILIVAFVSGICLPVFLLLSPLQPRVIVHLRDGGVLVWRDLTREADFVHRVEAGLRKEDESGLRAS